MNITPSAIVSRVEAVLIQIGEVGKHLAEMNACEGTAGNISVGLAGHAVSGALFPESEPYELPVAFPELANKSFLVTGSGCRLRDVASAPKANVALVQIGEDGRSGRLFTDPSRHFVRVTSEFYSHLVLHQRCFREPSTTFSAVVHAQPRHLTYLTHIRRFQSARSLSDAIMRWQPELTVVFPAGLAYVPFEVPNSDDLATATAAADPACDLIVWEKHGVLAISRQSVVKALDLVEYAETGAHYEYLNLLNGVAGDGLLPEQVDAIRSHFEVSPLAKSVE